MDFFMAASTATSPKPVKGRPRAASKGGTTAVAAYGDGRSHPLQA